MIKYAITRGFEECARYELVYVDSEYFAKYGHLDDSMDGEYEAFEKTVESLNISHSGDCTMIIKCDKMESELIKLISEKCPDAEYSDELYNFLLNEATESLADMGCTQAEINSWLEEVKENKNTPVANWRFSERLAELSMDYTE